MRDGSVRKSLAKNYEQMPQFFVSGRQINLWSHFSDEGEEWVLIRLASPRNTRSSRSPLLHRPCQLLAVANVDVTVYG